MTKKQLILLLLSGTLGTNAVERGDSRESVLAELGTPQGNMKQGNMEVLLFPKGTVTLHDGIVTQTDISEANLKQAKERRDRAAKLQKEKQKELEKQKQLYPENDISQVICSYDRTENWNWLPESIRPEHGQSRYFIYLPSGYYQSDNQYYPCLFAEHPLQWENLRGRIQREKWVAVILDEQQGDRLGQKMNENFLAAYDDALDRFRISKRKLFTAGGVPSLLYATLRPISGVILQEPNFDGIRKLDPPINLIRKNADMRVYSLLGIKDELNLRKQAQFIEKNIPKYHIDAYDGQTGILPVNLADKAIDWMKKEYRLP